MRQVLEGAFEAEPDLTYRPSLVSRVTIESKRPFVLTYHIRPEARWSDGVPVSASDFRFTQEAFATYTTVVALRQLYEKVRRAQILNAKTYRIELQEPSAGWRELYSTVLPRHALAGEDLERVWSNRIDNPKTGRPIGSGPFLVGSWERGRELTLVRNPRYWGDHTAYLDRVVARFAPVIPSPDALERVRRNEIDVALFVAREDAAQVRRLPGWRVLAWPSSAMEHLLFRVGAGGHPGAPAEARPSGARLRHRPCRDRESHSGGRGSDLAPATGQYDASADGVVVPRCLGRVSLRPRAGADAVAAGGLPAWQRLDLLVCRRAAQPPVRDDRG